MQRCIRHTTKCIDDVTFIIGISQIQNKLAFATIAGQVSNFITTFMVIKNCFPLSCYRRPKSVIYAHTHTDTHIQNVIKTKSGEVRSILMFIFGLFVFIQQIRAVQIFFRLPRIIFFTITFPSHFVILFSVYNFIVDNFFNDIISSIFFSCSAECICDFSCSICAMSSSFLFCRLSIVF